jgi:hypothetical protein
VSSGGEDREGSVNPLQGEDVSQERPRGSRGPAVRDKSTFEYPESLTNPRRIQPEEDPRTTEGVELPVHPGGVRVVNNPESGGRNHPRRETISECSTCEVCVKLRVDDTLKSVLSVTQEVMSGH